MNAVPACAALGLFLLASGCTTWTHAPGRSVAEDDTREVFALETPQLCRRGTCTLQGPDGSVRFSEVSQSGLGDRRDTTAFDIDYRGWKGVCRGPHSGVDGRGPRPLECTLMERGTGQSATLVVGDGCTQARLVYPSGRELALQTDTVELLGHLAPAREVSLLERGQVVAFSDRTATSIAFHRRPKDPLPTEQTLALLSMHAYAEMEGTPPECLARVSSAR